MKAATTCPPPPCTALDWKLTEHYQWVWGGEHGFRIILHFGMIPGINLLLIPGVEFRLTFLCNFDGFIIGIEELVRLILSAASEPDSGVSRELSSLWWEGASSEESRGLSCESQR